MNGATFLGKSSAGILGDVGTALLQIKNARGLTLEDMGRDIGVSREMAAQYIAGEAEMGFTKWFKAKDAYPELEDLIAETAADRAAKARQRALDLELPTRREKAA
jgi:transcriptional regulator with XRE-family HTH domain